MWYNNSQTLGDEIVNVEQAMDEVLDEIRSLRESGVDLHQEKYDGKIVLPFILFDYIRLLKVVKKFVDGGGKF